MNGPSDRVAAFQRLHTSGCFVMPNPWDAGTARALEGLGFEALATTSAGFAWTRGLADNDVTLDQALEHLVTSWTPWTYPSTQTSGAASRSTRSRSTRT